MLTVPRAHPNEFRDDVVAVARRGEARRGEASIGEVARDFGITESCLRTWLSKADVEDGCRPGVLEKDSAVLRELRRRNRLLEQEHEVLRRAADYLPRQPRLGRLTHIGYETIMTINQAQAA